MWTATSFLPSPTIMRETAGSTTMPVATPEEPHGKLPEAERRGQGGDGAFLEIQSEPRIDEDGELRHA